MAFEQDRIRKLNGKKNSSKGRRKTEDEMGKKRLDNDIFRWGSSKSRILWELNCTLGLRVGREIFDYTEKRWGETGRKSRGRGGAEGGIVLQCL
ncbi:conserved hypothetical protein [Ricinus communis]|uniref:Uncharacterized protein n=1 Tax=Ricinus communis TaxID=3988 RepID=B9RFC7_RICCO|nr:conserved hypothetical protein [Ricinus communis]